MRFAAVLAAVAALWAAQPAAAFDTSLYVADNSWANYTINVKRNGLLAEEFRSVEAVFQNTLSYYYYDNLPDHLWGNEVYYDFLCHEACEHSMVYNTPNVGAATAKMVFSQSVLSDDELQFSIFLSRSLNSLGHADCLAIPESDRQLGAHCGLEWTSEPQAFFTFGGVGADSDYAFSVVRTSGAIPEPSTWMLLILGLGLTGAMMRRHHYALAQLPSGLSAPAHSPLPRS